ncbi:hypothetical protein OA88_02175 [Flavobacterium sp. JRM]|nr:hypothetical protein OA88_02175 [Flavobacterium sp. JRM]
MQECKAFRFTQNNPKLVFSTKETRAIANRRSKSPQETDSQFFSFLKLSSYPWRFLLRRKDKFEIVLCKAKVLTLLHCVFAKFLKLDLIPLNLLMVQISNGSNI